MTAIPAAYVPREEHPMSGPLIISERSWHYRLYMWVAGLDEAEPKLPKTLCGYFWFVVLTPVAVFGWVLSKAVVTVVERVLGLGAVPATIILSALAASGLTAWGFLNASGLLFSLMMLGIIIGAAALFIVGLILVFELLNRRKRPETTSGARLLLATVIAKKRRICPLIEVRP
jgi:hypothetical protein